MLHLFKSLDVVQDVSKLDTPEDSVIGAAEPVFILRGSDPHAARTLRFWVEQAGRTTGDLVLRRRALNFALYMETWYELRGLFGARENQAPRFSHENTRKMGRTADTLGDFDPSVMRLIHQRHSLDSWESTDGELVVPRVPEDFTMDETRAVLLRSLGLARDSKETTTSLAKLLANRYEMLDVQESKSASAAIPGSPTDAPLNIETPEKEPEPLAALPGAVRDAINPKHYRDHPSGIECIAVVEEMNFNVGNAVKYLWRAGLKTKDAIEDLSKAAWYVAREIRRRGGSLDKSKLP